VTDNASRVTITLPSTCAVGDMIRVIGQGAGGWALNGTGITLTALSGSSLSLPHDSIFAKQSVDLVCVVANAQWRIHYVTSLPPPTLASVATQTLSTDTPFSYTLSASDVSGEPITYSCFSGCPVGLTVNATTGVVSWTPTSSQGGSYSITFSASNGTSSAQASTTFSVRHVMLDAIANQSLTVGVAFAYTLVGTSSAGAAVTYSCSANCPSGLSVNGGSGVVSWTPTSGQIGTFSNVTFLASDGAASATRSATFTVIDYPASCKAIKIANPSAASGTYTIDPDGAASSTVTPFTAYCDMTSGDGGWTLALVQNVGTNWAALSSAGAPTDPSAASSTVLTHQAFTAMSPTGMYLEDSARHILKFYYPRSGVTFVSNYRNLTERTAYNASHYGGDGPHTGVGRSSPGHADQACTTGSYAAFLAQSDCNVDATNSHPSWGNTPGGSQTYGGSSACWFYGGGNMTDIPSLTTCNTGDRAPWGTYTTGTLSGTIRLWIR
jgi:hypothetical protein